jgi:hypothetical protein
MCFNETHTEYVISEAFTAAKIDKIVSGYQPCQLVKYYRRFRDLDGDRDVP